MSTALIGKRLKALRDERGIDQDAVAAMIGVNSRQIVSNIETGERKVKAEELLALIDGLKVDLDYFTDPFRLVGEGEFSWRQNGRTVPELKAYERTAGSFIAMYRHEAPKVGRPVRVQRPKLGLTRQSSFEDAMAAGEQVGEVLGLGEVPAARLAEAMEGEFGILVLMVDPIDGISGAACRLPELDAVLVNRNEVPGRRHFDLAHELFHIMTWDAMPPDYQEDASGFAKRNRVEQLADNFASAILMPTRVLDRFGDFARLGVQEQISRINEVAEALLVTAQALKWRLVALGRLTRAVANAIVGELLRNNGFAKRDDPVPPLFSRGFMEVVGEAIEGGFVSKRRVARELQYDVYDLAELFVAHNVPIPDGV